MNFLDFLRINKIKLENEKLKQELEKTKNDLDNITLTKEELKYINLEKEINSCSNRLKDLSHTERMYIYKIKEYEKELIILEEELLYQSFGLYTPRYNLVDSASYKNKLNEIRNQQKQMIKNKTALNYFDGWTLNGSKQQGTAINNDNMKMVLRAFNHECESSIYKVKFNNISTIEKRYLNLLKL